MKACVAVLRNGEKITSDFFLDPKRFTRLNIYRKRLILLNKAVRKNVTILLTVIFAVSVLFGTVNTVGIVNVSAAGETIGNTADGTLTDSVAANYYNAMRYQAGTNMVADQMKIKIAKGATGSMKCAIYSDNNGNPGSLLRGTEEKSNLTTGWKTFNLTSPLNITAGSYYWLVNWRNNSNYKIYSTSSTGSNWWGSLAYAAN